MHVAFALMIGWPLARLVATALLEVFWCGYPLLVTFVIVATANHFLADAVLGAVHRRPSAHRRPLARPRPARGLALQPGGASGPRPPAMSHPAHAAASAGRSTATGSSSRA